MFKLFYYSALAQSIIVSPNFNLPLGKENLPEAKLSRYSSQEGN